MSSGVRVVAFFEALKGLLSVVVGLGIHYLLGHDLQQLAESLLTHLHLNPASHYPAVFLDAVNALTDARLRLIAIGAVAYSVLRFVEAYGLWYGLRWTEWLALVSGAIYVPFEVYEVIKGINVLNVLALSVNLLVIVYMFYVLFYAKKQA